MAAYFQLVVDLDQQSAVQGSFSLQPAPWQPFGPRQLGVVHDTRGHVTLRNWRERGTFVVGKAMWGHESTVSRKGFSPTEPSEADWKAIDAQILQGRTYASGQPVPAGDMTAPPWIDKAEVGADEKLKVPAKPLSTKAKIGSALATMLALGLAGGFVYLRKQAKEGKVANGDECDFDSDCRSRNCEKGTDGKNRCSTATQCRSNGDCTGGTYCSISRVCVPRQRRGERCYSDDECRSGQCTSGAGAEKLCE